MSESEKFKAEVEQNIRGLADDYDLQGLSRVWLREVSPYKYTYNFRWLGRPVIQMPQDMIAIQELVWDIRPDCIIETGVAHGGSLIYYASLLKLLGGDRKVIGIDIDIRAHNRKEIEGHPVFSHIELVEGSSICPETFDHVKKLAESSECIMVILDSNHTYEHVLKELEMYGDLVKKGSYLIVMDTLIDDMPEDFFPDRPWGKDNNPKLAVNKFLELNKRFEIDRDLEHKLLLSVCPGGYLKSIL